METANDITIISSSSPSAVGGFSSFPLGKAGMGLFSHLVKILGTSTKTNDKLEALSNYFATADDKDSVWVIALFSGRTPAASFSNHPVYLSPLPFYLFASD
jgi:DNA ligase-1